MTMAKDIDEMPMLRQRNPLACFLCVLCVSAVKML
jgi:hypothetical protein